MNQSSNHTLMKVLKRDNTTEPVSFDKITKRIKSLSNNLNVDHIKVSQKVIENIYDGVTTYELDELSAQIAAGMSVENPDYSQLAGRITCSNYQKRTPKSFFKVMKMLYEYRDKNNQSAPLISKELFDIVKKNKKIIEDAIQHERDFYYDFFGFKTLYRSYLMKVNGNPMERIQHMWMRVALGIHGEDIQSAIETYNLMSEKYFTHATPTLFNAGTNRPQLSSCFLIAMQDDSIPGIFNTLTQCAQISKWAGGIGLHIHNIRAKGTHIRGTNGTSNGIVPMLKVFNHTARYVDQGGGKRNGSFAIYLEPWHADIFEFLDLKKNHGDEEMIARDLFYALWIPDLFMKRVEENREWSLMCPDLCPGLSDVYGEDFEELYNKYEAEGKYTRQISARELWKAVLTSQIETGTPYMLYKDACNEKSNQKNLGTIKSSNLCTEILEYTSPDEIAVCNLASISLKTFVEDDKFNFEKLHQITKVVTRNLNKVIDVNYYPVQEAENSNRRHRPIGIGVQGLADTFAMLRYPFDSLDAKNLNRDIFETMYHASLEASNELAIERETMITEYKQLSGITNDKTMKKKLSDILSKTSFTKEELTRKRCSGAYDSYLHNGGSPVSNGILQFDMWGVIPSDRWNWEDLRESIEKHGVRNSLLLAPMPTASTSQILGNNECFEPFTTNMYTRRTLAGEYIIINKYLLNDLIRLGIWNDDIKAKLMAYEGSVQQIDEIPQDIKDLYKTVWEIKQKVIIDMAADRGAFIDQTQSMNLFVREPNVGILSSMHFYGWKKGLKTGQYYLRTKPVARAQQFTVDPNLLKKKEAPQEEGSPKPNKVVACNRNDPNCEACGS